MSASLRIPLHLRPLATPRLAPAAWLLTGTSAATWIDEIARWDVPMERLTLYVLPCSLRDAETSGVLVVLPKGAQPRSKPRGQSYAVLADRLYIPTESELWPPTSESELADLLVWDAQIFHPSIGLIGYREDDALHVHDLLALPAEKPGAWDRAMPGLAPPPRLVAVEPERPPTIQVILSEGKGDIGSESPDEVPPDEDDSTIKNLANKAGKAGAESLSWLAKKLGGAAGGGLAGKFADKLASLGASLAAARNREMDRLMKLFESDPDQALKYALPLSGQNTSRGLAPPGGRLGQRDVNFDLGALRGGRPGDAWALSWEMHQKLLAQYRAAANRELNLGRYRRAAYIFAHLLGDYSSAANALQQGRHFREAAVLYREHLHNAPAAARCLEQGGLIIEAIEIYETLKEIEKIGDLYARLERTDDAHAAYRRAVDEKLNRGDTLAAAALLEKKLEAPDEAVTTLARVGPGAPNWSPCTAELFALLGRLGRHEDSRRHVAHLADEPLDPTLVLSLTEVLSNVATTYPNPAVRHASADATRVMAGRRMRDAGEHETRQLVNAVMRLAVEDRLLARDGSRFVTARANQLRAARPPERRAPKPKLKAPTLVRTFHLGTDVQWTAVASEGSTFFALGTTETDVVAVRGTWHGVLQRTTWSIPSEHFRFILQPTYGGQVLIVVPLFAGPRIPPQRFSRSYVFQHDTQVLTPSYLPSHDIVGLGFGAHNGTLAVLEVHQEDGCMLNLMDESTGALRGSFLVSESQGDARRPMAVREDRVYVADGSQLLECAGNHSVRPIDAGDVILGLTASTPHTRLRLVTTFAEGARLFWPKEGDSQQFAAGLVAPSSCFTRNGTVAVVGEGEGRLYRTEHRTVVHLSTFEALSTAPLAVTPTENQGGFAVFSAGGLVRVMDAGK